MSNLLKIKEILQSETSLNSKNLAIAKIIEAERKDMYDTAYLKAYDIGYDAAIEVLEEEIYENGYEAGYKNAGIELAEHYGFAVEDVEPAHKERIIDLKDDELVPVPDYSTSEVGIKSPYVQAHES